MINLFLALICSQTLTLPEAVSGRPGSFIQVEAKTDCKNVEWVILDSGLELFPTNLLINTRTAVVTGQNPGVYRLLAYGAVGDVPTKPAITTITIGDGTPTPPEPEKSGLQRKLETLFKADMDEEKAKAVKAYAGVFRALAQAATDEKIKTSGELFKIGSIAASNVLNEKQITTIRDEIGGYLNSKLSTEVAHLLTAEDRKKAVAEFITIAKILEVLK